MSSKPTSTNPTKHPQRISTQLNAIYASGQSTFNRDLATSLATLMRQLEQTQWLPSAEIVRLQQQQLLEVAMHAEEYSPYFRDRLQAVGLRCAELTTPEGLRSLPVMTRRDLQTAAGNLFCQEVPKAHFPIAESCTSGSSGEPVVVKRTAITYLFWMAATLREHLWHERDFLGTLAVIRANFPVRNVAKRWDSWGLPVSLLFRTGALYALPSNADVRQQADWLEKIDPAYLLIYPTNLHALLKEFAQRGRRLTNLRQIRTIGETLHEHVRESAREILKVEIADTYSSQELGVVATQCPESGLYHAMSESVIVEVLDAHGQPCQTGQIGRVVLTDLHNFATPLIRYQIGDYAEVGPSCSCGRGLPTLRRIVGRERNMLVLPDGSRHWPLVGFAQYRAIAPIRQYQLIQRNLEMIEVRLVVDSPLSVGQEDRLAEVIRESLGFKFQLQFVYFPDEIPRSAGGKFEEFICEQI